MLNKVVAWHEVIDHTHAVAASENVELTGVTLPLVLQCHWYNPLVLVNLFETKRSLTSLLEPEEGLKASFHPGDRDHNDSIFDLIQKADNNLDNVFGE